MIFTRFQWAETWLVFSMLAGGFSVTACADDSKDDDSKFREKFEDPGAVTQVVRLRESALDESSGLATSRRRSRYFWSHNDSGGKPRLYAFDHSGKNTGQVKLKFEMVDWEDMASFSDQGVARLLIADCGDNQARRESIQLHLFDEPDPKDPGKPKHAQVISVVYPGGPRDCEAVGVDAHRRQIVLIAKTKFPVGGVYAVPLPARDSGPKTINVTARRLTTLPLPMVTAMDIDQKSGDIWVVSYFQAFQFRCTQRDMQVGKQLSALPRIFDLPRWRQIETVAVDDSHQVWLTSEGSPTPLGRLKIGAADPLSK